MTCDVAMDGVVGVCIRLAWMVCSCGWVEQAMERGMRSKRCLFCLLDFMLSVENLMFPIANLMVDGGCIATPVVAHYFAFSDRYIHISEE
jgi:hypothetical protein